MILLLDTSIIVPYLGGIAYDRYVWVRLVRDQIHVSTASAMELLAGSTREDQRQKVDSFLQPLRLRDRLVTATDEDWLRAGRMMARYQARYGQIKPGAHIADILILLAAARVGAEMVTENGDHFRTWSRFLPAGSRPRLTVLDRQAHLTGKGG